MTYYILEFERLVYVKDGEDYYETLRYVYANKKTALKMWKQANTIEALRNRKLIAATPNETLLSDA